MNEDLKHLEESRRERHWDRGRRWHVIQMTIAWAEAQPTVQRNTRQRCLAEQARKLADP